MEPSATTYQEIFYFLLRQENEIHDNSVFSINLYAYHREIKKLQHDADAPFYLSSSIEFDKLMTEAQASIAVLRKAILAGNSAHVIDAIQKLKDPYE